MNDTGPDENRALPLAIVGHTGFIGGSIVAAARNQRRNLVLVDRLPIVAQKKGAVAAEAAAWIVANPTAFDRLVGSIAGAAAVINAAGLAHPDETDDLRLWGPNAVLPLVLAVACREAAVPRFVHISTAAVQGFSPILDEESRTSPFSAYSRSKAAAETALLTETDTSPRTVIYRAPSVVHADRITTQQLIRRLNGPVLPMLRGQDPPLPFALLDHVAELAVVLATIAEPPAVVLHPWEGMTQRNAVRLMGSPRARTVTVPAVSVRALPMIARLIPRFAGHVRRISFFLEGQQINSSALTLPGYTPCFDIEDYRRIAERVRANS